MATTISNATVYNHKALLTPQDAHLAPWPGRISTLWLLPQVIHAPRRILMQQTNFYQTARRVRRFAAKRMQSLAACISLMQISEILILKLKTQDMSSFFPAAHPFSCAALACARCSKNINTSQFSPASSLSAPKTLGEDITTDVRCIHGAPGAAPTSDTVACELAWSAQQVQRGVSDR